MFRLLCIQVYANLLYVYIFSLVVNADEFHDYINDMQKECDFKYAQQFEVIFSHWIYCRPANTHVEAEMAI